MIKQVRIAPPNSLVLVMDHTVGKVPESMMGGLVAATDSCVAIGTLSEVEGETLILLSDEMPETKPGELPVFDGILSTPSKRVSVCSVLNDILLTLDVSKARTRVRIWANHTTEPDEIRIFAG